jgi:hypothetical protein
MADLYVRLLLRVVAQLAIELEDVCGESGSRRDCRMEDGGRRPSGADRGDSGFLAFIYSLVIKHVHARSYQYKLNFVRQQILKPH